MQGDAMIDENDSAFAGQAIYTNRTLRLYDAIVYNFNMPILWRCPRQHLLGLYDTHVSTHHLDVGVGSGYLLDNCRFPSSEPRITLMDLNSDSLSYTARRLQRFEPLTHQANVLTPWDLPSGAFDSIAMVNLLHCVPGTIREKHTAFEHGREVLAPGGTLFGATVLGESAEHTRLSRSAMNKLNRRGDFCNLGDRLDDLDAVLEKTFDSHQVEVQGAMALFSAQVAM